MPSKANTNSSKTKVDPPETREKVNAREGIRSDAVRLAMNTPGVNTSPDTIMQMAKRYADFIFEGKV